MLNNVFNIQETLGVDEMAIEIVACRAGLNFIMSARKQSKKACPRSG